MERFKKFAWVLVIAVLAAFSNAQAGPSVSDLVDANQAFIKRDRTNAYFGSAFGMHYTSMVTISGTIYTYYIRSNSSGKLGVGLATSSDGISFTDQGLVLDVGGPGDWDGTMASFPGIWYDSGTFYLVYEGSGSSTNGDIGLATSTNGTTFTKQGRILTHNTSGFESTNIGTPSLYKVGSTWYLYYHGFDGTVCQIGVATGSSLTSMTRYGSNPIVPTGSGWETGTTGKRSIIQSGSSYYMVYEGSTAQPYSTAKWSSGLAKSTDLLNWTKYSQNNVLNQTPGGSGSGFGNDGPDFLTIGGDTYIYFRGQGGPTSRVRIANESFGGILHSYAADGGAGIYHQIGRSDSGGWSVNVVNDSPGYMVYGPYASNIEVGDNIAVFKMLIDNNSADNSNIVTLEVNDASTSTVLASRTLPRSAWKATNTYEYFDLPYNMPAAGHSIEFRIYWHNGAYVRAGLVGSN